MVVFCTSDRKSIGFDTHRTFRDRDFWVNTTTYNLQPTTYHLIMLFVSRDNSLHERIADNILCRQFAKGNTFNRSQDFLRNS